MSIIKDKSKSSRLGNFLTLPFDTRDNTIDLF